MPPAPLKCTASGGSSPLDGGPDINFAFSRNFLHCLLILHYTYFEACLLQRRPTMTTTYTSGYWYMSWRVGQPAVFAWATFWPVDERACHQRRVGLLGRAMKAGLPNTRSGPLSIQLCQRQSTRFRLQIGAATSSNLSRCSGDLAPQEISGVFKQQTDPKTFPSSEFNRFPMGMNEADWQPL